MKSVTSLIVLLFLFTSRCLEARNIDKSDDKAIEDIVHQLQPLLQTFQSELRTILSNIETDVRYIEEETKSKVLETNKQFDEDIENILNNIQEKVSNNGARNTQQNCVNHLINEVHVLLQNAESALQDCTLTAETKKRNLHKLIEGKVNNVIELQVKAGHIVQECSERKEDLDSLVDCLTVNIQDTYKKIDGVKTSINEIMKEMDEEAFSIYQWHLECSRTEESKIEIKAKSAISAFEICIQN